MIREINSDNKVFILYIMRSVCVCLDILLKDPCAKEKLKFHAADNIIEILFDDKYAALREEVLKNLDPEDALTFKVRHRLATILPPNLVAMTTELLAALQRCEQKFIDDFVALMENEDPDTQIAANGMLQHVFDEEIINQYFNNQHTTDACITRAHIKGKFYLEWYSLETKPCYGGGYGYGGYGYGGYGYGGYGYGGYGYGGYGYGGYGYGGYGYGGYGYGGYGYGGYGYGGYGYGGYGYGGYGYGGYGYGGYGYGGYGYGGYGYGGYGNDSYATETTRSDYAELWDDHDFIWLNQSFVRGVRNAEGAVWAFKNVNERFTVEEGRAILAKIPITSGDHDQLLFRAVAHTAVSNPAVYNKLQCKR